ncbi:triosephosphate isomerase (TIM), partial [Phenoliferia sp. Uapishka_3]
MAGSNSRKFFVGGNFKMNGTLATLTKLVTEFNEAKLDPNVDIVIAPPALYIIPLRDLARKEISVAAQNAHHLPSGAYTGEISLHQLNDIGLKWVVLGHSERRSLFHETDELIATKTAAALEVGLDVIFCIGESLEERETNKTTEVVSRQLAALVKVIPEAGWSHIVVAYEPFVTFARHLCSKYGNTDQALYSVWAIGTGKVASPQQAQDTHADIRKYLASAVSQKVADETRIIYGGSVAAKNAKELASQPDIDGFLVGGASLKPEFVEIINANSSAKL